MGQYYRVALINNEWKVKVIKPDGWKLLEHSYYGTSTMKRIERILYRDAYNVMWIWDYAECADLVWKHEFEDMEDIFDLRQHETPTVIENSYLNRKPWDYYYLVNKSKKEFINMTKQEMNKELADGYWRVIHPLPILCRAYWDFWWWDYRDYSINFEYLWRRCGDIISVYHVEGGVELEEKFTSKEYWYKDMTNVYFFKE